jgi:dienelactone hydrolase
VQKPTPLFALLLFACAAPPPSAEPVVDAGALLTSARDAGDAGAVAPKPDAGVLRDGGFRDAGFVDAGVEPEPEPEPEPDACIPNVAPGRFTIECEGLTYELSVPRQCASPGCAVVFDVHGFTMSGVMQENNTSLAALTQDSDFIVVQPSATPAPPASNWSARQDDARVFDFMMRVADVFRADRRRLHITGFSDGGWLTWRFVCEHADVLASAAPAAASGYCSPERACDFVGAEVPAREIPLLLMLGTQDAYVEYTCAQEQVDAVVAAWSMTNEGTVERGDGYHLDRYVSPGGTPFEVLVHDYASDASVPLIPDLVGHCYPGSEDAGEEPGQIFPFGCAPPNAFHWGERVLEFFGRSAPQ